MCPLSVPGLPPGRSNVCAAGVEYPLVPSCGSAPFASFAAALPFDAPSLAFVRDFFLLLLGVSGAADASAGWGDFGLASAGGGEITAGGAAYGRARACWVREPEPESGLGPGPGGARDAGHGVRDTGRRGDGAVAAAHTAEGQVAAKLACTWAEGQRCAGYTFGWAYRPSCGPSAASACEAAGRGKQV